jgi:hypothetical protein
MNGDEVRSSGISNFLYASNAQTDEQPIVLTATQLQMLIQQAIAPLVAEIADLKQRIAELETTHASERETPTRPTRNAENPVEQNHVEHAPQDHACVQDLGTSRVAEPSDSGHEIIPLLPLVTQHDLESVKSELLHKIDEMYIDLQLDIAADRRRITALERPNYGEGSRERVNELHRAMKQHHFLQVTFAQAAKLLGVTYQRACQLRGLIAIDPRFKIVKDPRHAQRMLIRLTSEVNR